MDLFITIFAIIWFIILTCGGNYYAMIELKNKGVVRLKPWSVIGDILSVSWLLKMVIECLS